MQGSGGSAGGGQAGAYDDEDGSIELLIGCDEDGALDDDDTIDEGAADDEDPRDDDEETRLDELCAIEEDDDEDVLEELDALDADEEDEAAEDALDEGPEELVWLDEGGVLEVLNA